MVQSADRKALGADFKGGGVEGGGGVDTPPAGEVSSTSKNGTWTSTSVLLQDVSNTVGLAKLSS